MFVDLIYATGLADDERLALLVITATPFILLLGIGMGSILGRLLEQAAVSGRV